uniref:MYOF n=1 Tax=Macrostomum lignano TaxID=282301 RepID=A0A1I8GZW2_9PLAT
TAFACCRTARLLLRVPPSLWPASLCLPLHQLTGEFKIITGYKMTHYGGPAVAAIEEQMAAVNIHGEPVGELGWDELPDEKDIPINEDNYSRIRLRLDKPPQPSTCYVFLGDGKENCTFSGAFAQLRRSSRGIFSTDISVEIEEEEEEEQVEQVEQVEQEEQEEQEQDDWPKRLRIDATKMGEN